MLGLTALSLTDLVLASARLERVFAELALEYRQLLSGRVAESTCESSQRDRGASPRVAPRIALYSGRFGLLDPLPNHRPEFRRVLVGMNGYRVLHGGVDELVLRVRRDPDGAVHLARNLAAIDVLPGHVGPFCW